MIKLQKMETQENFEGKNAGRVALLKQYELSSRRERDLLWMEQVDLRSLFDEIENAEVFMATRSSSGFSIYRFNSRQRQFSEYSTIL